MDTVLATCDEKFLTPYVYPESWKEDDILRQLISLMVLVTLGGYILYFMTAAFSYYFIFDRRLMKHPLILEVTRLIAVASSLHDVVTTRLSEAVYVFRIKYGKKSKWLRLAFH